MIANDQLEKIVSLHVNYVNNVSFIICRGIEGDLMACVAMCPAVREKLGPALIHTYSSVDIVEGLDVDKEQFDKFSARYE